jgi:hypothetical protein
VKYKDSPGIFTVEDTTWRLDDLAITPPFELFRLRAKFRMAFKMVNMLEDFLH